MKIFKAVLVLILIFFVIKICTSYNTKEEIDYSKRLNVNIGASTKIADDMYITKITFTNVFDYSIKDITVKFIVTDMSFKPMANITKDILPSNYELPPGASYTYELLTKNYWYVDKVVVIYAN